MMDSENLFCQVFSDLHISLGTYGTSSEYLRDLIRKDKDRLHLRGLLLAGAASAPGAVADQAYFKSLRDRVGNAGTSDSCISNDAVRLSQVRLNKRRRLGE